MEPAREGEDSSRERGQASRPPSEDRDASEPAADRWAMEPALAITWAVAADRRLPHADHVEMSGRLASVIVRYGVDEEGRLTLSRRVVWPTLRTIPNNTHASLSHEWGIDAAPRVTVDGAPLGPERPVRVTLDGLLTIASRTDRGVEVTRVLFPTRRRLSAMERWTIRNVSGRPVRLAMAPVNRRDTASGVYGDYVLEVLDDAPRAATLAPGEERSFGVTFSGRKKADAPERPDVREEEAARRDFVARLTASLRLETPDAALNRAFDFAKFRAGESIFDTKGGPMHCPGGGAYYAAVWANDEVEYAGPFFPFLGNEGANEASLNAYRLYVPYMGPDYAMIPSSIIAEGTDTWGGAGDRGDAAMYAYGAARFALARGDRAVAEELWPAVEWCLEYCRRQETAEGVIASDSDELEGRFPTGAANLSTSTLCYGGLRSAADLARALDREEAAREYDGRAEALERAIEAYFGAEVEGYRTYRYYDGNDVLRSWICLPLTMGILERREGTVAALFSPRLWTKDGLATQAGDKTFWDRATLYGFRGALAAGATEKVLPYLQAYTRRRLLGEHVPYAVEAYPEGDQRQLSAESALYCRVFTEGLFGVTPTGLRSFRWTPRLPVAWDEMALRSVRAFGHDFDLAVRREGSRLKLTVAAERRGVWERTCEPGEAAEVALK